MSEKSTSTLILDVTAYTKDQILRASDGTVGLVEELATGQSAGTHVGTQLTPHIALAGRSNVGKSSLINALAGRKGLAKISSTPGKTRSLNFYRVKPEGFYLVDLPGYGYARCSKQERNAWGKLMQDYLTTSRELCALALLLDCRLPPQKLDRQLADFAIAHHIPILPILTKADKCKQKERSERQSEWARILNGTKPIITSSSSGLGVAQLWNSLREVAQAHMELDDTHQDGVQGEKGEESQ